ncbi:MAG: carbohydrate ABC transporter permease [Chloroflexia bacterium]|nr:carbohydrate ABC transporter permease [Chloroflexia bacterium]
MATDRTSPEPAARARSRHPLLHLGLLAGAVIMLYPLLWLASSSIKPTNLIFSDPGLWPREIDLSHYAAGWNGVVAPFSQFFINSAIIATGAVIGNLVACSMAAYAFARLNFRFKRLWFGLMLATIMLPTHATLIPQYILFLNFGWVNTFWPMIVPKFLATDAFFIFLMVQFIRGIPRELDEAAMIDGCGPISIYWRIILPLMLPALVTTAIFTFIWTYEDFLTPLVYLTDMALYTVPQGLRLFMASTGESAWGPLMAMSLLSLVPVFVIFLIFQRLLIEGISTTGIKG